MRQLPTIENVLSKPATIDDVIATLRSLVEDLETNSDTWENQDLSRYLSAMQAWLEAFRGKFGDQPSWRVLATALEAAKIYE